MTYEVQVSSIVVKWKTIYHILHPQLCLSGLLVNSTDGGHAAVVRGRAAVLQVGVKRPFLLKAASGLGVELGTFDG